MALIKCPECGKEISDKAEYCPNCGCPSSEWKNDLKYGEDRLTDKYLEDIYLKSDKKRYKMVSTLNAETGIDLVSSRKIIEDWWEQSGKEKFSVSQPHAKETVALQNKEEPTKHGIESTTEHKFNGIYKYTLFGGKQEVRCPRCNSENCSHYKEQKIIPGKTKTRYTVNLNPLRPFTLVNKKEKVIKADRIVTDDKFICNECGLIFN